MMTAAGPTPIKPKAGIDATSAGATSQLNVRKKAPQGPLVFVNSSDPNAESERIRNRKKVKKWAMLNKDSSSFLASKANQGRPQFLSWSYLPAKENSKNGPDSKGDSTESRRRSSSTASSIATPIDKMSCKFTNPFNTLPVRGDDHAKRLLHFFLEGMSPSNSDDDFRVAEAQTCNRVCFPLIVGSKGAFCAFVSALEANPWSQVRTGKESYQNSYLGVALSETYSLIKSSATPLPESACLSVSFLFWTAHFMGDDRALQVHFTGLAALAARDWVTFSRTPYFKGGIYFWKQYENEGDVFPESQLPGGSRIIPTLSDDQIDSGDVAQDFVSARDDGLVPPRLIDLLPYLQGLEELVSQAKTKRLGLSEAQELLLYIWMNASNLRYLEDYCKSPIQRCARYALTAYWYGNTFRNAKMGVGCLARDLRLQLREENYRSLIEEHPYFIMWLVMTLGPLGDSKEYDWCLDLLMEVWKIVEPRPFMETVADLERRFLWTRELDPLAVQFWDEASARAQRWPTVDIKKSLSVDLSVEAAA